MTCVIDLNDKYDPSVKPKAGSTCINGGNF